MAHSENDLIEALQTLADDLGRVPTTDDMRSEGEYSLRPYYRLFGSWENAKRAAGFGEARPSQISREELINELQRVAAECDGVPSIQDMRSDGEYSVSTYYRRFESWQNAQLASGFQPNDPETEVSDEELIEELQRIAEEIGRQPTVEEMNEQGTYWGSTYQDHFGSWEDALDAAGFDESPKRPRIEREALLEEVRRVAEKIESEPTFGEMREHGKFAVTTYQRRFESWKAARSEALEE